MNPLENSQLLAQMNQQQPPQQSPFSAGSLAAMDSIRNSLRSDDSQKRDAIGRMVSTFGAGMGNPANYERGGNGFGAAVASMGPAIQAYDTQNDANRSENMGLIEYMRKLEHEQNELSRRKKEHEDTVAHQNAQLTETKRYHDLMYREADLSDFTKKQEAGLIPTDAVPYAVMGKKEQGEVAKEQRIRLENIKNANRVLKDTKEIVKISNDYPDLSTDYNRLLINVGTGRNPTAKDIALLGIADQKKRAALEKFVKLRNELLASKVQLAGGKVNTDIFKKTLGDTLADPSSSNETINYIGKYTEDNLGPLISEEDDIRKAISGRYFVPQRINSKSEDMDAPEPEAPANNQAVVSSSQPQTAASPREAARAKLIAGGITNEAVIEKALQAKGL